jgi:hypothetical protein
MPSMDLGNTNAGKARKGPILGKTAAARLMNRIVPKKSEFVEQHSGN